MIGRLRHRLAKNDEHGAALVWVAGSLVMLLAFSALAVDLAWIYLNSSRLQNAADAAALAGVVNLPAFPAVAQSDAEDAATANGFPVGGTNSVVTTPLSDNGLSATLRTSVPTYFLKVLGFDRFDISRTSTAEYVKPVPLGSPSSCFGIGNLTSVPGCTITANQNYWAAINGRYTAREHGDPYAPKCDWGHRDHPGNCYDAWNDGNFSWTPPPVYPIDMDANPLNPLYRPTGYYYAVEIPSGKDSFTVELFDAAFETGGPTGDGHLSHSARIGPNMHYQLYTVDTTPWNPTDNLPVPGCIKNIPPGAGAYQNQWKDLCTVHKTGSQTEVPPGIYVLRVWNDGNGGGNNGYGLNVQTLPGTGQNARLYGINDISIYTNASSTGTLTIAEVAAKHAGKKLELKFYDPGEDNGDAFMTVLMPGGATANCTWVATNMDGNPTTSGGPGPCKIQTADKNLPPVNNKSLFNSQWITATINIPDASTYTCTTDCWWSILIEHDSVSHDRTTWAARVIGNPLRLVPNP